MISVEDVLSSFSFGIFVGIVFTAYFYNNKKLR